jgi:hypothetical protein
MRQINAKCFIHKAKMIGRYYEFYSPKDKYYDAGIKIYKLFRCCKCGKTKAVLESKRPYTFYDSYKSQVEMLKEQGCLPMSDVNWMNIKKEEVLDNA